MDNVWKEIVWRQLGGAVDMLRNAVEACPDELWGDRGRRPEFWHVAFHTLFFLDLYLSGTLEGFRPPEPFTLDELDPSGVMPERVYTKEELLDYLRHCREKSRAAVFGLTDERARELCSFGWVEMSFGELLLSNTRHVQHHAAQLNLLLSRETGSAPRWVKAATD